MSDKIIQASMHALRRCYSTADAEGRAIIDDELERRHQASLRKERRNLVANHMSTEGV